MSGRRINEDGPLVDWWTYWQEQIYIRRKLSKCNVDWLPDDQSDCNFEFNYSLKGFNSIWYYKYSHVSSDVRHMNNVKPTSWSKVGVTGNFEMWVFLWLKHTHTHTRMHKHSHYISALWSVFKTRNCQGQYPALAMVHMLQQPIWVARKVDHEWLVRLRLPKQTRR